MANPTTNYGFVLPTSTDLVTDLPADFDIALQGVDTRLKALQPGTTLGDIAYSSSTANTNTRLPIGSNGQVLAVSGGVPAWTTTADVTPLTTKGDLFTFTTVDARLAVGNNGETLVADSSTATGLSWKTPVSSLSNPVINGGMDIWQRGTTLSPAGGAYNLIADRWGTGRAAAAGGYTVSRQTTSDTTNLPNIQYCLRVARNNGDTITGGMQTAHNIETANSLPYAGKTVTVTFYVRKGSAYSGSTVDLVLYSGTGTDQNVNNGFTGGSTVVTSSITPTTTWTRYAITGTIPTTATELAVYWYQYASGTASSTNDYIEVTGVQIDVGTWTASTAPTFRRSGGTIQGELAACQRYYYRSSGTGSDQTVFTTFGYTYTTTNAVINFPMPVTMRVKPTAIDYANLLHIQTNGGQSNLSALTINNGGTNVVQLIGVSGAITNSLSTAVAGNASGTPFIGLSAEL